MHHSISDLLNVVYVNARTGTNDPFCGSTQATPCKDLKEGVERTKEYGTLHVVGNHHLQQTIFLSKSINLTSNSIQRGKIISNGSIDCAFKLNSKNFKVTGLHFEGIPVLIAYGSSNIEIEGITAKNIHGGKPTIFCHNSRFRDASLIIKNSRFQDSTGIVLKSVKNVYLFRCIFVNPTKMISSPMEDPPTGLLDIFGSGRITFNACKFSHFKGAKSGKPDILVTLDRARSVEILDSTFLNATGGGCVHIVGTTDAKIEGTKFERCTSKHKGSRVGGGATSIEMVGNGVYSVRRCMFVNNSAIAFGGALFVKIWKGRPIDDCKV